MAKIFCSFCGKNQDEVEKIIAGASVYICDECIGLCVEILFEKGCPGHLMPYFLVDSDVGNIGVNELVSALAVKNKVAVYEIDVKTFVDYIKERSMKAFDEKKPLRELERERSKISKEIDNLREQRLKAITPIDEQMEKLKIKMIDMDSRIEAKAAK